MTRLIKKLKKTGCTLAILFAVLANLSSTMAASNVTLSFTPTPNIDIVLAKAKTATNLTNFETNLKTSLASQGVDISKVNVLAIDSQEVNISTSFNWVKDVSSSIGSISITNNGQNVIMYGNQTNLGKNAIWIMPDKDTEQEFNFGYNISFGDSFNAAGMLLRAQRTGNVLKGYMLSFNNYNWSAISGTNGAIWQFTYNIGDNYNNITKTLVKSLSINQSGTLNVKATNTEISISGGGLSGVQTYTYPAGQSYGPGFGFFSDHYSHNCDQIGSFSLTNINLKTTEIRKFEDVLRAPNWRTNSIKVLVNVDDYSNTQLSTPGGLGELLTRMINDNIYFVGWGTNANASQFTDFITSNDGKGLFINNTNYNTSINSTAAYIKSLIPTEEGSEYLILNEQLSIHSDLNGILTNTAGSNYPYGKWKLIHDPEYFENDMGQFTQSGNYLSNMITIFPKTGRYEILFEDNNIVPQYVYVHRRPVAEFAVERSGTNVILTSLGYDLDKYSVNNGIAEEEWKYRKVGETTWTDGKLSTTVGGTDFIVSHRVKDFQNTWSEAITKYITTSNVNPIASFEIKNLNTSLYENIEIVDGSYDPMGGTITNRNWTVYKNGVKKYEGSTPLVDYASYGIGEYTMSLVVTNDRNQTSEVFSRTFTIIPDDEPPECTASPMSCNWTKSVNVNLTFKDRLGSGFKSYDYAITTSQTTPSTWVTNKLESDNVITITGTGEYYLHIKAYDNANNFSTRVLGPYKLDNTAPTYTATPTSKEWSNSIDVALSFADSHSGFKSYKYAITRKHKLACKLE